jgi:cytochrome c-type biogenesis protein CcmF
MTFAPLFVLLMLAMPMGPLLAWKRGDLYGVAQRLMAAGAIGIFGIATTFAIMGAKPVLAPFGIGLALFVMIGAVTDIAERSGLRKVPLAVARRRAFGLPRSAWGTALAHFGLGLTLLGIVGEASWNSERIVSLKPTQSATIAGYELTFDGLVPRTGSNFREVIARFTVRQGGATIAVLEPSKRTFATRSMTTTEAALLTHGVSQLYVSLGDGNADGSIAARIYYKPLVLLIWLGAVVMVLGGGLSLSDRRLRVGAPRRKSKRAALAPQPAE